MNIRLLKKGDLILIACVAIIAGLIFVWNTFSVVLGSDHLIAEVRQDGRVIKKIDLNKVTEPEHIYIDNEFKQVILAENGRIRFLESNCRDKICVKAGWLTKIGSKAVCMPAKTIITINGESKQTDSTAF